MYVIVKGSCHVRIQKINADETVDNPVVATLYDGTHFGELNI